MSDSVQCTKCGATIALGEDFAGMKAIGQMFGHAIQATCKECGTTIELAPTKPDESTYAALAKMEKQLVAKQRRKQLVVVGVGIAILGVVAFALLR